MQIFNKKNLLLNCLFLFCKLKNISKLDVIICICIYDMFLHHSMTKITS